MEIPWTGNRCIICLEDFSSKPSTKEHIFLKSLGGKLWSRLLCGSCNNTFGHTVDANVRCDPGLRLTVEKLDSKIPSFVSEFCEGQEYIAQSQQGYLRGKWTGGAFHANPTDLDDGSRILPMHLATQYVAGKLGKNLQEAQNWIDNLSEDSPVNMGEGLCVVKRSCTPELPTLDGPMISNVFLLKVAYEFLALFLGKTIYDASLDPIRQIMRGEINVNSSEYFNVDHLRVPESAPWHRITLERGEPYINVLIRFFRLHSYRVHFKRVACKSPRFAYTHDLESGEESWHFLGDGGAVQCQ